MREPTPAAADTTPGWVEAELLRRARAGAGLAALWPLIREHFADAIEERREWYERDTSIGSGVLLVLEEVTEIVRALPIPGEARRA